MAGARRAAGGVQEQRAHEQGVAGPGGAQGVDTPGAQLGDPIGREAAEPVRAGEDPQRAVGLVGVVEVEPDRQHPPPQLDRGLDVRDAPLVLHGPKPGTSARERTAMVKS